MNSPAQPSHAVLRLKKDKIAMILAFARVVYAAMLAEAARFTAPVPTLVLLLAQINALDLAQQAIARSPRGTATGPRNTARDALWASLRSLQHYVQTLADADAPNSFAIIKSAGFDVALTTARDKPVLAADLTGFPGGVKLVANARALTGGSQKAATYNWAYSLDGGHTWVPVPGTPKATTTVSGLPVMSTVSFRVSVTLGDTMEPWAQSVTIPVH
jgi:hypothetical protein